MDRCDRCTAQARDTWALWRDDDMPLVLVLCGHHSRETAAALTRDGWELVDTDREHVG